MKNEFNLHPGWALNVALARYPKTYRAGLRLGRIELAVILWRNQAELVGMAGLIGLTMGLVIANLL